MTSILPIYSDTKNEIQDWKKSGYYSNWQWSLIYSQDKKLIPFIINGAKYGITSGTISAFKLLKLSHKNPETVLISNTLSTSLITVRTSVHAANYIFYANTDLSTYEDGLYQYYIEDSNGNSFYSGYFCHEEKAVTIGGFSSGFSSGFRTIGGSDVSLIKMTLSGIPNIYPSNYEDKVYLPYRTVAMGTPTEEFVTSQSFKSSLDSLEDIRAIQTIAFNEYHIEIFNSESQGYELMNAAKNINFAKTNGTVLIAKLKEKVKPELQENTQQRILSVVFEDHNLQNYMNKSQPLVNHLSSLILQSTNDVANLWALKIESNSAIDVYWTGVSSSNIYSVYTSLQPETVIETDNHEHIDGNRTVLIQSQTKKRVTATLFLSETQKDVIENYASKVDKIYLTKGGSGYNNLDNTGKIDVLSEKGDLRGLWKVTLTFTYELAIRSFTANNISAQYNAKLTIHSTVYYTNIEPSRMTLPQKIYDDMELPTGERVVGSFLSKDTYMCTFYLTGGHINAFLTFLADSSKGNASLYILSTSSTYTNSEVIVGEPEQIDGMTDLIKVDVKFVRNLVKTDVYD